MFVYEFQSSISKKLKNVLRISLLQLASLQISFSSNKNHLGAFWILYFEEIKIYIIY